MKSPLTIKQIHVELKMISVNYSLSKRDKILSVAFEGYGLEAFRHYQPKPPHRYRCKSGRWITVFSETDKALHRLIYDLLKPEINNYLSKSCYSSHIEAILDAQKYAEQGYHWIAKLDMSNFYDNICHQRLIRKLLRSKLVSKRLLLYILKLLGIKPDSRGKGIPTGSPLSSFLANLYLHFVIKQLEGKDIPLYQLQDDIVMFFRTRVEARRWNQKLKEYLIHTEKLVINTEKSLVSRVEHTKMLGFILYKQGKKTHISVADSNIEKFKTNILTLIDHYKANGCFDEVLLKLNEKIIGWANAYRVVNDHNTFKEFDAWVVKILIEAIEDREQTYHTRYQTYRLLCKTEALAKKLARFKNREAGNLGAALCREGYRKINLPSLYAYVGNKVKS